jgi:IclR family acetate operon transcriptional repressor
VVTHSVTGTESRPRPSGAETARRALHLVELLAEQADALPLATLVSRSGLPKATAYRLLRVLQEEGWTERSRQEGYRIGPRLRNLAERINPRVDLEQLARPHLQRLAASTAETATLYVRRGTHAELTAGAESPVHALRLAPFVGERTPLNRGAAGIAILAHLPDSEQAALLGPTPPKALTNRLTACRRDGYALSSGENHPGVNGIAAPLTAGNAGPTLGSIAVAGPASRWDPHTALTAVPELLRVCAELSAWLHPPMTSPDS